ncbi:hypothetical protein CWI38_0634p0020 [Hamiltosporidium tvaerminnensis]|uniref:Uncharacterized protein n=1 Tax=Hamiltosporidium tvaerminnensis TaxID=1176355 RepID=A0A4Q9LVX8_9MICR|nr:hypothetical protein CWI38_0634p0020 [Hamiltosporidium tvaerminnensis]
MLFALCFFFYESLINCASGSDMLDKKEELIESRSSIDSLNDVGSTLDSAAFAHFNKYENSSLTNGEISNESTKTSLNANEAILSYIANTIFEKFKGHKPVSISSSDDSMSEVNPLASERSDLGNERYSFGENKRSQKPIISENLRDKEEVESSGTFDLLIMEENEAIANEWPTIKCKKYDCVVEIGEVLENESTIENLGAVTEKETD